MGQKVALPNLAAPAFPNLLLHNERQEAARADAPTGPVLGENPGSPVFALSTVVSPTPQCPAALYLEVREKRTRRGLVGGFAELPSWGRTLGRWVVLSI